MYAGAGAAVLTNWARAVLVIDPTGTPGVYRFIAAKRGKRIGWGNDFAVYEQFWAHSTQDGQLLWLPANEDQIRTSTNKGRQGPDDLLDLIPPLDPILQDKLFEIASAKGIGEKKARRFLKILIDDQKAYEHRIRRFGAKSAKGYAKNPEPKEVEC